MVKRYRSVEQLAATASVLYKTAKQLHDTVGGGPYNRATTATKFQGPLIHRAFQAASAPKMAYDQKMVTTRSKTKAKKRSKPGNYKPAAFQRAGFFAKGKKKTTRYKKSTRAKLNKTVTVTEETGFTVEDDDTTFVGHSNMPIKRLYRICWMQIVKELVKRAGVQVRALDEAILILDDEIQILYRLNPGAAVASTIITIGAGENTVEELGSALASIGRPWNTSGDNAGQVQLIEIKYLPQNNEASGTLSNRHATIDLQGYYLDIFSKSTLKMQNRTVLGTDDKITDIDAQPLNGKFYEGSGNGTRFRDPQAFNNANGLLFAADRGEFNGPVPINEPPLPFNLKDVKKFGKARLDPGELKTSVLVSKRTIRLDLLCREFNQNSAVAFAKNSLGVFRIFAFEKMIQVFDTEASIIIAAEQNIEFSVSAHQRLNNTTVRLFNEERQV